jgi:hypothetical protein
LPHLLENLIKARLQQFGRRHVTADREWDCHWESSRFQTATYRSRWCGHCPAAADRQKRLALDKNSEDADITPIRHRHIVGPWLPITRN